MSAEALKYTCTCMDVGQVFNEKHGKLKRTVCMCEEIYVYIHICIERFCLLGEACLLGLGKQKGWSEEPIKP